MPLTQNNNNFYQLYGHLDILFNKDVIKITKLLPKNIILRCGCYRFPLVLQTLSMKKALAVVQNSSLLDEALNQYHYEVEIRFFFGSKREFNEVSFFAITGTLLPNEIKEWNQNFKLLPITFKEESNDLVQLLTPFAKAEVLTETYGNSSFNITASPEVYGIKTKQCYLTLNEQNHRIYLKKVALKTVSFLMLKQELLIGEEIKLYFTFNNPNYTCAVNGVVVQNTLLKDNLMLVTVDFNTVPINYKMFLSYLLETQY